jgi:hypothetical protein
MHPRCVGLFLLPVAFNVTAEADGGLLYLAPEPSNFISPDAISTVKIGRNGQKTRRPYWHFARAANQTRNRPNRYDQVGHDLSAKITCADGSAKTSNMSNTRVRDVDKVEAAIPMLRIIDVPECSD